MDYKFDQKNRNRPNQNNQRNFFDFFCKKFIPFQMTGLERNHP